jgi:hypothetical protein
MSKNMMNECWTCKYKRTVPCNAHISCSNADPNMSGDPYGIQNGWFLYPILFDPIWKIKDCSNYETVDKIQN